MTKNQEPMTNFGYTISSDRQIDYDKNDLRISGFLLEYEPSFKVCFACGTCTATCSAGIFTEFSLREMIGNIKRGEVKKVKSEVEKCMLCGKCQLACPRGVNTRNIILGIQRAIEAYKL
jgi:heterodisulfide reductase subunit C